MRNESTLKLKRNFIEERATCKSTKEIAEKYKVTTRTVYNVAKEVSEETGIEYDDLLFYPGRGNPFGNNCFSKAETLDLVEFWKKYDRVKREMKKTLDELKKMEETE